MILITGGSGYIGGLVANYFQNLGFKIRVTTRDKGNISLRSLKNCEICETDLTSLGEINKICKNVKYIFHFASLNSKDSDNATIQENEKIKTGINNLLEAAIQNKIKKFLYLSTAHVYGENLINEVTENTIPLPNLQYAKNHLETERIITKELREKEIELMILRLSNMVAVPNSIETKCWHLVAHDACKQAIKNKKIILKSDGSQIRDFFSAFQLFDVLNNFINSEKKYSGIYNLGSGSSITINDLMNIIKVQHYKIFENDIDIIYGQGNMVNNKFKYNIDKLLNNFPSINSYNLDFVIYRLLLFCEKSF
tara:strand:- start:4400 stop:5329 length:930 start_codon:yes stop_codon:yes gene_type:complete